MLQSIKRKCKHSNFARTRKQAEKPPGEPLAAANADVFQGVASLTFRVERSDDRKYVCVRILQSP